MSYVSFNPNPYGRRVDDCVVRALAAAIGTDWHTAFDLAAKKAREMGDMPHSDSVWGSVLRDYGFERRVVPNTCPDCYTAEDFCDDHPDGVFVLAFGGHVATVVNGFLFDSWDSSGEIPAYYWRLKNGV